MPLEPHRRCAVCEKPLVYSERLAAYRCAYCQRHTKSERDEEREPLPYWDNVT